jgi:hypothetical protein
MGFRNCPGCAMVRRAFLGSLIFLLIVFFLCDVPLKKCPSCYGGYYVITCDRCDGTGKFKWLGFLPLPLPCFSCEGHKAFMMKCYRCNGEGKLVLLQMIWK